MTSSALEGGYVVALTGRVDASTVTAYREILHAAVDRGFGPLVLDLADVDMIDATGLGMLVGTQRRVHRVGRQLLLRHVPVRIARLLRASRLDRVLPEESSLHMVTAR